MTGLLVNAILAWTLLAFGGVYAWTLLPTCAGVAVVAMLARPRPVARAADRALDVGILAVIAAVSLQAIPLPASVVDILSPYSAGIADAVTLEPAATSTGWRPLSVNARATGIALAYWAAAAVLFWSCRDALRGHRLREVVRRIAWAGLVVSVFAIIQRASSPGQVYWRWTPQDTNTYIFGPFVNRNHFATWMLLAAPCAAGYAVARLRRGGAHERHRRMMRALEAIGYRTVWLLAAAAVMTMALGASLSRSGLAGLAVEVAVFAALARRRGATGLRAAWALAAIALGLGAFARWGATDVLLARVAAGSGSVGRLDVWRETLALASRFWLAGVGHGGYETAMLVFQRTHREMFFNTAHNEYLQTIAESGVLVGVPLAWSLAAFVRLVRRRLDADASAVYWMRAGAVAGLAGVAAQSVWETGLRMPANALLAAFAAAVAVHPPRGNEGIITNSTTAVGHQDADRTPRQRVGSHDIENGITGRV